MNTQTTKLTALLMVILMLFTAMIGCAKTTEPAVPEQPKTEEKKEEPVAEEPKQATTEEIELVYYVLPGYTDTYAAALEQFNAIYPNIKVTVVDLPTDSNSQYTMLSTIMTSQDTSVDVIEMDCVWPQAFISAGWLSSMDEVLTEEEKAEFYDNSIELGYYNGIQYSLPTFINSGVLFYRKDLLEKYGYEPPKTWTDLIAISKDIMTKEPEITSGFSSAWKQYEGLVCCAMEFIWAEGGNVLDADGNVVINSPETASGLQLMYDMLHKDQICDPGICSYMWTDSRQGFYSGNVLFMRDWPSAIGNANDPEKSNVVGNVGFVALPCGSSGTNLNTMGGWQIGVSAFSQHQYEAKLLAKFMAGYEVQKLRAINNKSVPSRPAILEDADVVAAVPFFNDLVGVGENTMARPRTAYYSELSGSLQQHISAVLTNVEDIPTALAAMQAEIEEIMAR